jgi:hypothetical protein
MRIIAFFISFLLFLSPIFGFDYPTVPNTFISNQIISSAQTNANNTAWANAFADGTKKANFAELYINSTRVFDNSKNLTAVASTLTGNMSLTGNISQTGNQVVTGNFTIVGDTNQTGSNTVTTLNATNLVSTTNTFVNLEVSGTSTLNIVTDGTYSSDDGVFTGVASIVSAGTVTANEFIDSSDSGTSTQWNDAYGKRVDTWGNGLEYSTQTAAVDYNTTNLKITSNELDTIQSIATDAAMTLATLDTGQGANELYDMDQNVLTTSDVTFNAAVITTITDGTATLTSGDITGLTSLEVDNLVANGIRLSSLVGNNLEVVESTGLGLTITDATGLVYTSNDFRAGGALWTGTFTQRKSGRLNGWTNPNPIAKVAGLATNFCGEIFKVSLGNRGSAYSHAIFTREAPTASLRKVYELSNSYTLSAKYDAGADVD